VTQGHWLEGPEAHSQASPASSARAAMAMAATARDQGRRRSGARGRRGRGPEGPGAQPEHPGEVSLARDGMVAANLVMADSYSCRRNGNGGGDSRRSSSIPGARRTREVRRC
jgi:hypothetical protein